MINSKHCKLIFWNLCLIGTSNVLAFCLPANFNILPIYIFGGALSLIIYQCFPHEDVCLIFVLGSVSRNTVPRGVFPNTLPREQEVYGQIIWSLKILSFNIIPVSTEYQEIHPYSVVNIDNVKINTTMMREWPIFKQAHMGSCQKPGLLSYTIPKIPDDFEN